MSILIDPYMFELTDEQEIRNNIAFFMKIIKIASHSSQENKFPIAVYQGMIEKMKRGIVQPFPISMDKIRDRDLRCDISQINNLFSNALLHVIESVDIDECHGEQEFAVTGNMKIANDEKYYELLNLLLVPCYKSIIQLDDRILTGIKAAGMHIGDSFEISCDCNIYKYRKICRFVGINEIIPEKDKVIETLKDKRKKGEIQAVTKVSAEMGKHHNHIQANGKGFSCLDDLSTQNKAVLRLLAEIGLFKIIFGRFTSEGVRAVGTMLIQKSEPKENQDILLVKFSAETGMVIETSLYFQKDIGVLVHQYFKDEQLSYKNVYEFVEKIK